MNNDHRIFGEPAEFAATTTELRREAIRLKVRAERAKLHPSVIDGFADFVTQLDAFALFLSNIGAIERAAMDQAVNEQLESGIKGISAGASTHSLLSQNENFSGRDVH
jgi:flagellar motor protein MotB